jgi:hypothetical protein
VSGLPLPLPFPIPVPIPVPEQTEKTDMSAGADLAVVPPVDQVFAHWKTATGHPKAKLTPKRKRAITDRLREGYPVDTLLAAVDGCRASPFHQGDNKGGTVYDDIELICRDGEHVEKFVDRLRPPPKKKSLAEDPQVQAFFRGAQGGDA